MSEEITVEINSLGNRVGGIASNPDRKTVFVRGALPGETVRCRINRIRKNLIEAEPVEILESSSSRIIPFCRYFGDCGGCSLQNLEYSKQLFWKRNWIEKALSRAGIEYSNGIINDLIPSPCIEGYRNRVSFDITAGRPGLHRFRGDLMHVNSCPLLNKRGQDAFRNLPSELHDYRRVSVRASDITGEAMVEFYGPPVPQISTSTDRTDIIAWQETEEWKIEPSGSLLHETVGRFTYPVRPGTFFQVNTAAAAEIISKVTVICRDCEYILDLYGGSGTFALPLASIGAKVTSIELNPDSSMSGEEAAALSGITGIEFLTGRARHYLKNTVQLKQKWDAVIVDPPRAGLGIRISRLLRRIESRKIIYVSCNPFSLARDLQVLCERGWAVAGLQPVDMFPQTDHVESVVELNRKEDK